MKIIDNYLNKIIRESTRLGINFDYHDILCDFIYDLLPEYYDSKRLKEIFTLGYCFEVQKMTRDLFEGKDIPDFWITSHLIEIMEKVDGLELSIDETIQIFNDDVDPSVIVLDFAKNRVEYDILVYNRNSIKSSKLRIEEQKTEWQLNKYSKGK